MTIQPTQAEAPKYELPDEYECGSIRYGPIDVFPVLHWQEDGDYVFRSPEVDVLASAPSLDEAIGRFIDNAEDLMAHFLELWRSGEATEGEIASARLLMERFDRVRRHLETEHDRRLVSIHFGGRRRLNRGYALSPRQRTTSSNSLV